MVCGFNSSFCLSFPQIFICSIPSEKEEENEEVEDMEVENSMECKLSLNSYKIRFVKGSEDYLYRRQALKRAKEVSCTCYNATEDGVQQ